MLAVVIVTAGLLLDVSLKKETPALDTLVAKGEFIEAQTTPADGTPAQTQLNASTANTANYSTEKLASKLPKSIVVFSENTFLDLPEPHDTPDGLVLKTFEQARDLCTRKNKRIPTTLDVAKWAARNGAFVGSTNDAKRLHRNGAARAINVSLVSSTNIGGFYFDKDQFVYPKKRAITNASVWTQDDHARSGLKASRYAFSLYSAAFYPVPETAMLAVICLDNTSTKETP